MATSLRVEILNYLYQRRHDISEKARTTELSEDENNEWAYVCMLIDKMTGEYDPDIPYF